MFEVAKDNHIQLIDVVQQLNWVIKRFWWALILLPPRGSPLAPSLSAHLPDSYAIDTCARRVICLHLDPSTPKSKPLGPGIRPVPGYSDLTLVRVDHLSPAYPRSPAYGTDRPELAA